MLTSELDFELPEALIARHPLTERDESRLLVVHRESGSLEEDVFRNIGRYLNRGDCLALNDTRVIRARLLGKRRSGGRVEIFLLREEAPGEWITLVRPSAKVKPGSVVELPHGITVTVGDVLDEGRRRVHLSRVDVLAVLEQAGVIPLPPYLQRSAEPADAERYQTVYARASGAVAAPTAGLHYTQPLLEALQAQGVSHTTLTLHVGYGTFKPIAAATLDEHRVEPEQFVLTEDAAAVLNKTRSGGGRIVAVGTTCTRVLEAQARAGGVEAGAGETALYIHPPYQFKAVGALQTNFHLPKSSLLALVCAFAGRRLTLQAYRHAIDRKFRFYSYGDAMLIL
jgi:S-adenosylmethionine:tRNA ribosyltransferase-isomerase